MNLVQRLSNYKNLTVFVFLVILLYLTLIQFASPSFLSTADPYYHVRIANSYWIGEDLRYPIYASISEPDVDLYVLYHILLSPFTAFFDGANYESLVIGSKIFHILIMMLIIVAFYGTAKFIFEKVPSVVGSLNPRNYALLTTLFFLSVCGVFSFRLSLERPHLMGILLMLLAVYALMRKSFIFLFLLSVLFPLFYSVSFLILIPVGVFVLLDIIYKTEKFYKLKTYYPLAISIGGLTLGILLHPETLGYLYNAYYVHIHAIINIYDGKIPEGGEVYPYPFGAMDWMWLLMLLATAVFALKKLREILVFDKGGVAFEKSFIISLTFIFFILTILSTRSIEYLLPLLVLSFMWIFVDDIYPATKKLNATAPLSTDNSLVLRILQEMSFFIIGKKILLLRLVMTIVLVNFLAIGVYLANIFIDNTDDFIEYARASNYIAENSEEEAIIFYPSFGNYPRLMFMDTSRNYVVGIANTFTYLNDSRKYWFWRHISDVETVCPYKDCNDEDTYSIYDVMKDELNVDFVFVDHHIWGEPRDALAFEKFTDSLEEDGRFNLVFQDSDYPWIVVYSLQ